MRLQDLVLGRPLSSREEEGQKVGVLAGIPMLGLDALSSAAYGPEAGATLTSNASVAVTSAGPVSAGCVQSLRVRACEIADVAETGH